MKKSPLVPCPSCARHVRVSDAACPFCASALPDSLRAQPAPQVSATRRSRAALYAIGAGTMTLASACSSGDTTGGGNPVPLYGGPPVTVDGGADAGSNVDGGDEAAAPLYGGPPVVDDGGSD